MTYSKHKDASPQDTVRLIRNAFDALDVDLKLHLDKRVDGIFSATLADSRHGWNTSGKGTSPDFCTASAYGEAIEHFCNYFAYDLECVSATANDHLGFSRYHDEQQLSLADIPAIAPDVYADMLDSHALGADDAEVEEAEVIGVWTSLLGEGPVPFVPYYSVRRKAQVLLPDVVVSHLCGSNGGGAGNTPEEAIGHGLDEILERYAKYRIYSERLTPPTVPRAYVRERCSEIADVIDALEATGDYSLTVKDASLGEGLSVLCVLFVDRGSRRYLVNFGAHPCFELALERCLTELLQCYSPDNEIIRPKDMEHWCGDSRDESIGNWVSLLRDDTGVVPHEFFAGDCSWDFVPWPVFESYSNSMGMEIQLRLLLQLAPDVYIRDNGFLGFPVYRVYVPGISVSHIPTSQHLLECLAARRQLPAIVARRGRLDENDLTMLRDTLFSDRSFIGALAFKAIGPARTRDLHAALLNDLGEDDAAAELVSHAETPESACIREYLALKRHETPEGLADAILEVFFDDDALLATRLWRERSLFPHVLDRLVHRGLLPVEDEDRRRERCERIDRLQMRFKHVQQGGAHDQSRLGRLLDDLAV